MGDWVIAELVAGYLIVYKSQFVKLGAQRRVALVREVGYVREHELDYVMNPAFDQIVCVALVAILYSVCTVLGVFYWYVVYIIKAKLLVKDIANYIIYLIRDIVLTLADIVIQNFR